MQVTNITRVQHCNNTDRRDGGYELVSLSSEYSKHLSIVVLNDFNQIPISNSSFLLHIHSILNINFSSYFYQPSNSLYSTMVYIYQQFNLRNSGCKCTCKCETKCTSYTICICLCTESPSSNGCRICMCKHENCKCICISICKNGENCGTQHTCDKCLIKVDIVKLKNETWRILYHLWWIRWNLCKQGKINYLEIISSINWIELLFKEVGTKILELTKIKNILSLILNITQVCNSCNCKDKIPDLIGNIEKALKYYSLFGSRLDDIRSYVYYKMFYPKSEQILCIIKSSVLSLSKHLSRITFYIVNINNNNSSSEMSLVTTNTINYINTIISNNIFTIVSKITIVKYNVMLCELSKYLYNSWDILGILSTGIRPCCCICCYECCNKNGQEYETTDPLCNINNYQYYLSNMAKNHGNSLCLCLVTKYVLIRNVTMLKCYMDGIMGELYISFNRRFGKYTHSSSYMFSVGKLIMMIISVIYKITHWMKLNYLCHCPPNCPCCTNGSSPCSCNCQVCRQPAVPCCTCPKEQPTCSNGQTNNNCICKCKNGQGTSCCNCNNKCTENKCCRCCCNCFCKNYNDPYYSYLISTILFVSSLIEKVWSMDPETVRMSIEKMSNLYAQLEIYDLNSTSLKPVCCNPVYSLVVTKECKPAAAKKCCWCVACYNLAVILIYLCLQFKLYKAITKKDLCEQWKKCFQEVECKDKGLCCLIKLALSSALPCDEELEKVLQQCKGDNGCAELLKKVKAGLCKVLLLGCECSCTDGADSEVKANCVFFNDLSKRTSVAVVVFCKCKEPSAKCCCLVNLIEKLNTQLGTKLKKICQQDKCVCDDLKNVCKDICGADCSTNCADGCPCKELEETWKKICKGNGNCGDGKCLCQQLKDTVGKCIQKCTGSNPQCSTKDGSCRCPCCKVLGVSVRILSRACKQNVLEPYKRITLDLMGSSKGKNEVIRTIIRALNMKTLYNIYLVKNNFLTSSSYPNLNSNNSIEITNWGHDTSEHQVTIITINYILN